MQALRTADVLHNLGRHSQNSQGSDHLAKFLRSIIDIVMPGEVDSFILRPDNFRQVLNGRLLIKPIEVKRTGVVIGIRVPGTDHQRNCIFTSPDIGNQQFFDKLRWYCDENPISHENWEIIQTKGEVTNYYKETWTEDRCLVFLDHLTVPLIRRVMAGQNRASHTPKEVSAALYRALEAPPGSLKGKVILRHVAYLIQTGWLRAIVSPFTNGFEYGSYEFGNQSRLRIVSFCKGKTVEEITAAEFFEFLEDIQTIMRQENAQKNILTTAERDLRVKGIAIRQLEDKLHRARAEEAGLARTIQNSRKSLDDLAKKREAMCPGIDQLGVSYSSDEA